MLEQLNENSNQVNNSTLVGTLALRQKQVEINLNNPVILALEKSIDNITTSYYIDDYLEYQDKLFNAYISPECESSCDIDAKFIKETIALHRSISCFLEDLFKKYQLFIEGNRLPKYYKREDGSTNLKIAFTEENLFNLLKLVDNFYANTSGLDILNNRYDMILDVCGEHAIFGTRDDLYAWLVLPRDLLYMENRWQLFKNHFFNQVNSYESDRN